MGTGPTDNEMADKLVLEEISLHMIARKAPDVFAPNQGILRKEGICSQASNTPTGIQIGGEPARTPLLRWGATRTMGTGAPPKRRRPQGNQGTLAKMAKHVAPVEAQVTVQTPMSSYEYPHLDGSLMEPPLSYPRILEMGKSTTSGGGKREYIMMNQTPIMWRRRRHKGTGRNGKRQCEPSSPRSKNRRFLVMSWKVLTIADQSATDGCL